MKILFSILAITCLSYNYLFSQSDDFDYAIANQNINLFEKQIQKGVNLSLPDSNGEFIIYKIIGANMKTDLQIKMVGIALKNGADINAHNPDPGSKEVTIVSPLHVAIKTGNLEMVKFLISNKSEINDQISSETPLVHAINIFSGNGYEFELYHVKQEGYLKIIEYLLNNGADVNLPNRDRAVIDNPIILASYNGLDNLNYFKILKLLLEKGSKCDVYESDKYSDHNSPLHLLLKRMEETKDTDIIKYSNQFISTIEMMLKNDGNPDGVNSQKISPTDIVENKIATTKNQKVKGVCVNILKALKAKQNAGN